MIAAKKTCTRSTYGILAKATSRPDTVLAELETHLIEEVNVGLPLKRPQGQVLVQGP